MAWLQNGIIFFSILSFLVFGIACFTTRYMRSEFDRYGLGRQRVLVGVLQCLGSLGLWAGLIWPQLGQLAAGCLALLMLLGVGVRIKIKDPFLRITPALGYFLLNLWICVTGYPSS